MITAQIESFVDCLPELERLFSVHWEELALFKDRVPLAPQYAEYARRERAGVLFLATVRWNGDIVGYYTAQCAAGFHYGNTFTATHDLVYILPEVRDKGLAFPLFRLVERELKRRGVQAWYSGYKASNPLGMPELLSALGFKASDSYMVKWLGQI